MKRLIVNGAMAFVAAITVLSLVSNPFSSTSLVSADANAQPATGSSGAQLDHHGDNDNHGDRDNDNHGNHNDNNGNDNNGNGMPLRQIIKFIENHCHKTTPPGKPFQHCRP
jgi:hypothetical protein